MEYTYDIVDLRDVTSEYTQQIKKIVINDVPNFNRESYMFGPDKITQYNKCVCAFDKNNVIGIVVTLHSYSYFFKQYVLNILYLFVVKEYRENGIASELLNQVQKMYPQIMFQLHVSVKNIPAINLYKKYGFIISETHKNYYKDIEGKDFYVGEGFSCINSHK